MTSRAYFSTFRDRRLARRRQLLSAKTQLASRRRVLVVWLLLMLALIGLGGRLVYLAASAGRDPWPRLPNNSAMPPPLPARPGIPSSIDWTISWP